MNASILRSLARILSDGLGPEWGVGISGSRDNPTFAAPYCAVLATTTTSSARGAAYAELAAGVSIIAYPTVGISTDSSALEAHRVERLLWQCLAAGIDTDRHRPMRLPLWNYEQVPLFTAGPVERIGYFKVVSPTFQSFANPTGDGTYIVTCDIRVSWTERISPPAAGRLTTLVGMKRAAA